MFKVITSWLRNHRVLLGNSDEGSGNVVVGASEIKQPQLVSYDEGLLERSRCQWQNGDWRSLAGLQRLTLQHHPDRARLALLAAAGHQQLGSMDAARQFIRLAQDWGCPRKLISQVLIAGAHYTLGRAAIAGGNEHCALDHLRKSISLVTPAMDPEPLLKARLGQPSLSNFMKENLPKENVSNRPKISIIVPFYNAVQYLEQCVNTITRQSFRDYEVLLIDDGSTDDGLSLIKELTKSDSRFRIYTASSNRGVSVARNLGISEAQGALIRFMDVDDTLPSNSLEILERYSSRQDFVRGGTEVLTRGRTHIDLATDQNYIDVHPFVVPMPARSKIIYGHCSMLFSTQFIIENGIRFPEYKGNAEDTTFLVDCFFHASRVSVIKDVVYHYRRHDDSLSNPSKPDLPFFINSLGRWVYIKKKSIESGCPSLLDQAFESALKNYIAKEYFPKLASHLTTAEIKEVRRVVKDLTDMFDVSFSPYGHFFDSQN
ncbi:TPA: glycosyltransferase family 2 protein [Pseudomonas putida]